MPDAVFAPLIQTPKNPHAENEEARRPDKPEAGRSS